MHHWRLEVVPRVRIPPCPWLASSTAIKMQRLTLTEISKSEISAKIEEVVKDDFDVEEATITRVHPEDADRNVGATAIRVHNGEGPVGRDVVYDIRWDEARIDQKIYEAAAAIWRIADRQ